MAEKMVTDPRIILLVEDDPVFLSLGQELLHCLGYHTLIASGPEAALKLFRQHHRRINLVIADFNLPRLDGYQLLRRLQGINPRVKVIVASGFLGQEEIDKFWRAGVAGLISKPFRAARLQAEIVRVLGE